MHRETMNPRRLKLRRYTHNLIELNEYLASLAGEKQTEKIGVTELNKMFLDSMPTSCSK